MNDYKEKDFDLISELGYLAIGSRMKRLADSMMNEVSQLYSDLNLDFKARYFPICRLLMIESPLSVIEIARKLRITHPAVNQIVVEMLKSEFLLEHSDINDKRKRLISISSKGYITLENLKPVWELIESSVKDIVKESSCDILECIRKTEISYKHKGIVSRFYEKLKEINHESS